MQAAVEGVDLFFRLLFHLLQLLLHSCCLFRHIFLHVRHFENGLLETRQLFALLMRLLCIPSGCALIRAQCHQPLFPRLEFPALLYSERCALQRLELQLLCFQLLVLPSLQL
jgi:hypothetical protein